MTNGKIIRIALREARLKRMVRRHLKKMGFGRDAQGRLAPPCLDKAGYRKLHQGQREDKIQANHVWVAKNESKLFRWFADGAEIVPSLINPQIELVKGGTWQSDLFRFASLYWQIPVSEGYGRRLRFLVWDKGHNKLLGIFALGDAVFNQSARDSFIGWDHHRRSESLVNLMDAYVLGALPPYSHLLGGKLVASLIRTREVVQAFEDRYVDSVGLISKQKKNARLIAVTTSSALGRSSIYNRLHLQGRKIFQPIGFTSGWGHFHFSGKIFEELRQYLVYIDDSYARAFNFGSGPNWRLRVIRRALDRLGMDSKLARHGLAREVFIARIATNAEEVLRGDHLDARYDDLPSVSEIGALALKRWVIPRSERDPRYLDWRATDLLSAIHGKSPCAKYEKRVSVNEMGH
ncbi:Druantia anti-phage system protein DruA [Pseudomonas viridiflava]|uniref:Druantia anti-phage system protein DruA n=1 Tax=Pseudomonas viridiflava TaxID=33069 RepID=UPI000F023BAD|nr:Druantia anti-phage system protein DruA [Pseudomonas viridiflava]